MSHVLVGVSASAACFKAVALCSQLTQDGHDVRAVLSRGAQKLVTALQFSAVTGNRALTDEWQPEDPAGMDHIAVARWADVLVAAPASADRIGLFAQGLAPDLLGSIALALEPGKPRLYAPAMNPVMWANPAVQRNVEQLEADGWQRIGPVEGATACQEVGAGRMTEADEIAAAVARALGQ